MEEIQKRYIEFKILHQVIERTDNFFVVDGSINYLHARFDFCEDWQAVQPVAVFTAGEICKKMDVVDGECLVPWEVLQPGIRKFYVGCFAGSRITSNAARVDVNASCLGDPEESLPPTPDVYDELLKASKEAVEVANSVREDADSGAFIGPPGPKGDAGVIDFIVVKELPAIGDGSKIYLMPELDGEEPNRFGEYVFIEGAWERIGSAGVEVNLDEYVKNTDFADNSGKAGIVKLQINGNGGLVVNSDGQLSIQAPSISNMKARNRNKPITSAEIENAMWLGITGYKETWNGKEYAGSYGNQKQLTEEEKGYAREWLGVDSGYTGKFIGEVIIDNDETRTIEFTQCEDGSPLNFDELLIMAEGGADATRPLCFTTNNEYESAAYQWTVYSTPAFVASTKRYLTLHCRMIGGRWITLDYTEANNVYGANLLRNYTAAIHNGKERCINSLIVGIGWGHFTNGTKIAVYGR